MKSAGMLHQSLLQIGAGWRMKGRRGKRRSECGWGQHTLLDPQPEEMKGASPQPAVSPPAAADACRAHWNR